MPAKFLAHLNETLSEIETQGLMKKERPIVAPQRTEISVGERDVINLSANNYLGFADHPDLVRAARKGMDDKSFGWRPFALSAAHKTYMAKWSRLWRDS